MERNDLDGATGARSSNNRQPAGVVNQFGIEKQFEKLDLSERHSGEKTLESSSPGGQVPVPRKRTQSVTPRSPQIDQLSRIHAARLEAVTKERDAIKLELDWANDRITSLELELEDQKYQSDSHDPQLRVETDSGGGLQLEYHRQCTELSGLKLELSMRCSQVDSLTQQKQNLEKEVSELKLKSIESSLISAPAGGRPMKRAELRLNEALKHLQEKEREINQLKEQMSSHLVAADKLKLCEQQLEKIIAERDQLSQQNTSLRQQVEDDVKVKGQQLSHQLEEQKKLFRDLQLKHAKLSDEHAQLLTDTSGQEERLKEAASDYERLEQSSRVVQEQQQASIKDLSDGMASLKEQLTTAQEQCTLLQQEKQQVEADKEKYFAQANDLERELGRLKGERQQDTVAMAQTLEAIKQEAGQTLGDYNELIVRLSEAEGERDQYRMKHEQVLSILATRTQELRECQANTAQRLEEQAKEAAETHEVLQAQMTTYREDFHEERKAREGMAAESGRLRELLDEKTAEISTLRRQLNEHAQSALHDHFEEPPMRAGGYHGNGQQY